MKGLYDKRSSLRKAPKGEEDRDEGLEKSGVCEVGLPISCCDRAKIPSKGVFREVAAAHRRDPARTVLSEIVEGNAMPGHIPILYFQGFQEMGFGFAGVSLICMIASKFLRVSTESGCNSKAFNK